MIKPFDPELPASWQGLAELPELAIIEAFGPDAAAFLHAQLSQDVLHLSPTEWRRAAFCSAKGRMLASLTVLRPQDDRVLLLCDASVAAATVKRLSMFVLRAKLTLRLLGPECAVVGVVGEHALRDSGWSMTAPPGHVVTRASSMLLRLEDVLGVPRWLWLGPSEQWPALRGGHASLSPLVWEWLDLISGVPRVTAAIADAYVPQMLNFEKVHGVNFQKGCYPGQEVVARSEYRGAVKRRLAVLHSLQEPGLDQEVFLDGPQEQAVGRVIRVAPTPGADGLARGHDWSLQAQVQTLAWGLPLHLGSAQGPLLQWGTLPYALDLHPETSKSPLASNP